MNGANLNHWLSSLCSKIHGLFALLIYLLSLYRSVFKSSMLPKQTTAWASFMWLYCPNFGGVLVLSNSDFLGSICRHEVLDEFQQRIIRLINI
ncbi:hypothetical protein BJ165DRAFT_295338 [Panaeolus papilionaceus]|nr:hypothetical protein BJ165DRAFT_295338 [Panaeolus papilionaceus]